MNKKRKFIVSTNDQALFSKQSLEFEDWADKKEIYYSSTFSSSAFVLMIPQQGIAGIQQPQVNQVPQIVLTVLYTYISESEYKAAAAPGARANFQTLQ